MKGKKKMAVLLIGAGAVVVAIIVLVICLRQRTAVVMSVNPDTIPNEVFTLVDSDAEAAELATAYGIELISCRYGVATYRVPEGRTALEVIEYGKQNGLKKLELNRVNHID